MGDGEKLKAIPGSGERSIQTKRGRTVAPCPPTPTPGKSSSKINKINKFLNGSYEIVT
jgi:hypothetical protein